MLKPKTVAKWKKRNGVNDAPTGPGEPRSTFLSKVDAVAVFGLTPRHDNAGSVWARRAMFETG